MTGKICRAVEGQQLKNQCDQQQAVEKTGQNLDPRSQSQSLWERLPLMTIIQKRLISENSESFLGAQASVPGFHPRMKTGMSEGERESAWSRGHWCPSVPGRSMQAHGRDVEGPDAVLCQILHLLEGHLEDTSLYWTLHQVPKVSTTEGFHCTLNLRPRQLLLNC